MRRAVTVNRMALEILAEGELSIEVLLSGITAALSGAPTGARTALR
jgi:hypothetical protein